MYLIWLIILNGAIYFSLDKRSSLHLTGLDLLMHIQRYCWQNHKFRICELWKIINYLIWNKNSVSLIEVKITCICIFHEPVKLPNDGIWGVNANQNELADMYHSYLILWYPSTKVDFPMEIFHPSCVIMHALLVSLIKIKHTEISVVTLRPVPTDRHIRNYIFQWIFLKGNYRNLNEYHWTLLLVVWFTKKQYKSRGRKWFGTCSTKSHYLKQSDGWVTASTNAWDARRNGGTETGVTAVLW